MSPALVATRSAGIYYHVESIFAIKHVILAFVALAVCRYSQPVTAVKNARRSSAISGRTSLKATILDNCKPTHPESLIFPPRHGLKVHSRAIRVVGGNTTAGSTRVRSRAIPRTKKQPTVLCPLIWSHVALVARHLWRRSCRSLDNHAKTKLPIARRPVVSRWPVAISVRKPAILRNVLPVSRRWTFPVNAAGQPLSLLASKSHRRMSSNRCASEHAEPL